MSRFASPMEPLLYVIYELFYEGVSKGTVQGHYLFSRSFVDLHEVSALLGQTFELSENGLTLKEVYPGIDEKRQIRDMLDFDV